MEKALNYRELRPNLEEYLKMINANRHPLAFILDRVQNKRNIAAMFRLADAARVKEIVLYQCGIDADQHDKIKKVARSAQAFVPQRSLDSLADLQKLKTSYHLVALEITNHSVPYFDYRGPNPLALVIGNEQKGISREVLHLCEESIHVPMMGRNSSMNVAMATGIATYGLLKEMGKLR
jgi:tRNA G18 (ribose-2'-O)-methylase SpoU